MQYTVHICGYLGVVIYQLPPRRVHTGKCTTAILAELIRMIGCYPFEVPNDDDNSQGRSVRMPKRRKAAPHFCGGKALVNMSAAWYLVSTYWIDTLSSAKISDKHERFTLWAREMRRSLGLYPLKFFTTRIVAWLSSMTRLTERWRSSSHS